MRLVISLLKYIIGAAASVVVGYLTIESWVDAKVQACEQRIMKVRDHDLNRIMELRNTDLMHFNNRLNSIDGKLDIIINNGGRYVRKQRDQGN